MSGKRLFVIQEVAKFLPAEETFILRCIETEWIQPANPQRRELDEADVARLRFILELKENFGANDESIPLLLHLMDQLHTLHARLEMGPSEGDGPFS